MKFTHALVRRPNREMAAGLTTSNLGPPDHGTAMAQFEAYVRTLMECGMAVTVLDPLEGYPDAHFVEDAAVVTPELAIITRPGAPSRQGETHAIAAALAAFRPTVWIEPPGTLDGGDVLMVDGHLFVGLSDRTNASGAQQLGEAMARWGWRWTTLTVAAGLHLKSSVNALDHATLLTTRSFADHPALAGFRRIVVAPEEDYAANTLRINDHLIVPAGFPETRKQVESLGVPVIALDTSEFRKMDGGLTCLSLRF